VELGFDDKPVTVIEPGEEQAIYSGSLSYARDDDSPLELLPPSADSILLDAEMRIDKMVADDSVWAWGDHPMWEFKSEGEGDERRVTYTLTMTEKAMRGFFVWDTHFTEYFEIINRIDSDIVVELESGNTTTIVPGQRQVIHIREFSHSSNVDIDIDPTIALLIGAKMRINGELAPAFIWWSDYWTSVGRDTEDRYNISFTSTLTVTDELMETLRLNTELVSVTRDYKIINQSGSEINVELRSGVTKTIKPGSTEVIYNEYYARYRGDADLYRYISLNGAEMKIGGKAVTDQIWRVLYWSVDVDAEDHYVTYSLTATDQLLKSVGAL
jgi:hypothetical protein